MLERRAAITTYINTGLHTFFMDAVVDDAIYAGTTGHLIRPGGLDQQDRNFVDLLVHFTNARRAKDNQSFAGMMGTR